jgi:cytoskeletal protein CcmA (bactofilin family)
MSVMAEHYDEMTLLLYLERQLEPEKAQDVSAHMASCPACSALLRSLQHEGLWLRESLTDADESVPARLLEAPSSNVPWGWVLSLGLGAAGIYALWSGIVEPWQQRFMQAGFTQGSLLSMLFFSGALWKGWGEMTNLVEISATVGVMLIIAMLLRHNWRRWTAVGVVLGGLAFALAMPPAAMAGDFRKGNPDYTLEAGQKFDTDMYVTADNIRIDGDVNGDVFAFGGSVTVNGHITGDLFGFVQHVEINGHVDGNVRTWSQRLTITGTVDKNVLAAGDEVQIDPKGMVGGSVTAFAGEVSLYGPVGRDVLAHTGQLIVNNKVGGNVKVSARSVAIESHGTIAGGLTYRGEKPPRIDSGGTIVGAVQSIHEEHVPEYKKPSYYRLMGFNWAAEFLFGLVMILVMPAFYDDVQRALDHHGISAGVGFFALIGTPVAAILACITIVGLAVGISTMLLYIIALYATHVVVGGWIGRKTLGMASGIGAQLGRLALGLAILTGLKLVPYLRVLVAAIVLVWGLGAIAYALYRRVRPAPVAAPAV